MYGCMCMGCVDWPRDVYGHVLVCVCVCRYVKGCRGYRKGRCMGVYMYVLVL